MVNLDQDLIEGGSEGVQLNIFSDVELNQIQDLLDSVDPEDVIQMNPDEDLEVYIDRMDDSTVGSRAGPYDDSGFDSTAGTGAHFYPFFSLFPHFKRFYFKTFLDSVQPDRRFTFISITILISP